MKKWWMFEVALITCEVLSRRWQLTRNQKECDEHAHHSYLKLSEQNLNLTC